MTSSSSLHVTSTSLRVLLDDCQRLLVSTSATRDAKIDKRVHVWLTKIKDALEGRLASPSSPPSSPKNEVKDVRPKKPNMEGPLAALWGQRIVDQNTYVTRIGSDGRAYVLVKNQSLSYNPAGRGGVPAWNLKERLDVLVHIMTSLERLVPHIPDGKAKRRCQTWLDRINKTGVSGVHELENTHPDAAYVSEGSAPFDTFRPSSGVICMKIQQVGPAGNTNDDRTHLLGSSTCLAIHELVHIGHVLAQHQDPFFNILGTWSNIAKHTLKLPGL